MIILGIDPGTATTGFGILEKNNRDCRMLDYGEIRTHKSLTLAERLNEIGNDLKSLIKKWKPHAAAVEKIYFAKNVKTAISVAHARGVIIETLITHRVSVAEYSPLQVKVAVSGDGKADKKAVQKMVKILLNLRSHPKPDDAADALAIALCHAAAIRI